MYNIVQTTSNTRSLLSLLHSSCVYNFFSSMEFLSSEIVVMERLYISVIEAFTLQISVTVAKSLASLLVMTGSLLNVTEVFHRDPILLERLPITELNTEKQSESENKDASEDDDEDDDEDEDEDELDNEDAGEGEEEDKGNVDDEEGDPEDEPEANGDGGSGEDEDEDEDDDENENEEGEEEEEEEDEDEEDEDIPQPPSKKRK